MGSQMTIQRMTELLRAEGTSRSRTKLRGAFTRILQLTRILVREQQLDLHDVPQFFHLDFKVVDNVFGSVEVPQEGAPEAADEELVDDDPFAALGDIRPRMADVPQDDYGDGGIQGRYSIESNLAFIST